MINRITRYFKNLSKRQREIQKEIDENLWAHIYHDSIRGVTHLEKLPLNVGRWAGNYSFFYVLNRVLSECKPKSIIEFGLGESSKMISSFVKNELVDTQHIVIEQDKIWTESFNKRFQLNANTQVIHLPLIKKLVNGFEVNSYEGLESKIDQVFDLYVVDGPFRSERFSRFDIVLLLEKLDQKSKFIVIMDDTNRKGEKDTLKEIKNLLKSKNIVFYEGHFSGNKTVSILVSAEHKFIVSI